MQEMEMGIGTKKSEDGFSKIAISREADGLVSQFVARVNDGFDAGRVTKQEIVTHMISEFVRSATDMSVQDVRAKFFDPILLMESTLRKAKESGEIPDSLRTLLFEQFMNAQPTPKKIKKPSNGHIIKDNVTSDSEAA